MAWPKKHMRAQRGFSITEIMTVAAVAGIITAIAIPQMIAQKRLFRTAYVSREMTTQMRYARQLAMSRRQAFTFQYDNTNKRIRVIGPIPSGPTALTDAAYPSNAGSSVILTIPLGTSGLAATELAEGIPTTSTGLPAGAPTIPTGALGDGISKSTLTSGNLNITFQPDGTVIDNLGAPADKALFYYNNKAAQDTASAISVVGASGRIKVWRYGSNANKYNE